MDAQAWLLEHRPDVEAVLERWLPGSEAPPSELHAAMRHLVFPGGKRFRPGLVLAAAKAVGGPSRPALPMAAAVELIHVYSLIHDDLPCMDDDEERRGRPTVHVLWGEATAVLAGDALQSLAFEGLLTDADPILAGRAARDLAEAIGAAGLVGGQVDDLRQAESPGGEAFVLSIHERKTAALIQACVVGGARLAAGSEAELLALSSFGLEVGVAFQIADDGLDADEDESACSLVSLIGRDACLERAEDLLESALSRVEGMGEGAEPLRALARFAVRRDA